jgi:hypothetical protein
LTEIAELNMTTLSHFSQNKEYLEGFSHMSKPEDCIRAQVKLAKLGHQEVMTYMQKAGDIWIHALEEMSAVCQEATQDVTAKASEIMRPGQKNRENR